MVWMWRVKKDEFFVSDTNLATMRRAGKLMREES